MAPLPLLLMDVRIGTSDGQAAGLDTASPRQFLLVGDVGRGKTTTARHRARWWRWQALAAGSGVAR